MEVGLGPGDCVMGTQLPLPKKGGQGLHNFRTCVLWPNGCMDQDDTWHGGRPRHRPHCARWRPSSPPQKRGAVSPPQFSANVRCGQTCGWTKMPLGMEVGLGPGESVFDGDPAFPQKKGIASTQFWPMSTVAKRLNGSRCHLVRRINLGPVDVVLDGVAAPPKRGTAPSFRPMSIVAKRLDG